MSSFINIPSYNWQTPVQNSSFLPTGGQIGDARVAQDTGNIWVLNNSYIWVNVAGGTFSNSFIIMQTPNGTYPTATSHTDTLTFTSSDNSIIITGNSTTDTIDLVAIGGGGGGAVSSVFTRTGAVVAQSGDYTKAQVGLGNVDNTSDANKAISTATQTALDLKVDENAAITGATKTKITYDAKGLVTSGADATTADISTSINKNYVTDAQLVVIGNTSGTNTGDQNLSGYELLSNKSTSVVTDQASNTKYPSVKAVYDWAVATFQTALGFTPANSTRNINTTSPIIGGGDLSADRTISIPAASTSVSGHLTTTDWNTFNDKQAALGFTPANSTTTISTTAPLTGGGDLSANRTFAMADSTTSVDGYLSGANFTIFNNKLGNTFESVSKNLREYDYVLNYTSGTLTSVVYTVPAVGTITKTLSYSSGVLQTVVLSGSTPAGIDLTKTLTYTSGALTGVAYT